MDKNKVQRMRNLVTGDYGSKTKKQTGYKKYNNKKQEGDVWEESGRIWTIKNGIKQNIRKLDKAKSINRIPMKCPKCDTPMNKSQHKFMYIRYNHCLYCQDKFEMLLRQENKYNDWLIKEVEKNFKSWKKDKQSAFKEYMEKINSKHYITESGQIEDWSEMDGKTKLNLINYFKKYLKDEEIKMNKLIEKQQKKEKVK